MRSTFKLYSPCPDSTDAAPPGLTQRMPTRVCFKYLCYGLPAQHLCDSEFRRCFDAQLYLIRGCTTPRIARKRTAVPKRAIVEGGDPRLLPCISCPPTFMFSLTRSTLVGPSHTHGQEGSGKLAVYPWLGGRIPCRRLPLQFYLVHVPLQVHAGHKQITYL